MKKPTKEDITKMIYDFLRCYSGEIDQSENRILFTCEGKSFWIEVSDVTARDIKPDDNLNQFSKEGKKQCKLKSMFQKANQEIGK